jgi:5'-3' exonuclease
MKQPIKKSRAEANGVNSEKTVYSLIVDGNNLLKISLVDKTMNSKGEVYGAVMSFIRILGTILNKKDFNYCMVCWDGIGSGVLRWKLYEDYKANRGKNYALHDPNLTDYDRKMIEFQRRCLSHSRAMASKTKEEEDEDILFEREKSIIKAILEELCIRQYEFENTEGDDIIAFYTKNKNPNEKVVIVSADKDLTQLISDTVIIYNPRMRDFVTKDNSVEKIGITHENVVLEKILCGDASDNIKGVKGIGETTLIKLFPQIKDTKTDLNAIIERSKQLLEERAHNKKKPLKSLENIINGVTDGCQGDKLYEINQKIIDLSEPLLTDEARESLTDELYGIMDTSDRDIKNVYKLVSEFDLTELTNEEKFSNLFSPFGRIIMMENKRFKEYGEFKKNSRKS